MITSAVVNGANLDVQFELDAPAGDYRVEFFANPNGADPSGNGEGEVFNDAVAREKGIEDDALVRIWNDVGDFVVPARTSPAQRPDGLTVYNGFEGFLFPGTFECETPWGVEGGSELGRAWRLGCVAYDT